MNDETPKIVVDSIAQSLFHLAATLLSRCNSGETFLKEDIEVLATRLQDHAADLQVAASRLK